jgi:hypothetical protein
MLRITAACFAACLAAGCFSHPAIYPDNWAQPEVSGGSTCPSIEGRYANAGQSVFGARSLTHILNGGTGIPSLALWNKLGDSSEDPARDLNETVSLSLIGGELTATATRADGSNRSMTLPTASSCRDGLLQLEGDWDADFELIGPPAPEFSRKSIAVGRASDGSLLVRESKTATQWFLLTPAFGYTEATWIRFEEAPTVASTVAEATP